MRAIIAMAGLAEAAESQSLVIFYVTMAGIIILLSFAWWKRGPVAAGISCIACLFVGLFLQPWSAFHAPEFPEDPDEIYWLTRWRIASVFWVIVFLAAIVCLSMIVRRRYFSDAPTVA
jgi:hypothetical protein